MQNLYAYWCALHNCFIFIFIFLNIYSFIWLHQVLVAACGIQFPDQGSNLGPLLWELRELTIGPAGKSLHNCFKTTSKDFCNFLVRVMTIYYQCLRKVKSDRCFYKKYKYNIGELLTFIMVSKLKFKCQNTLNQPSLNTADNPTVLLYMQKHRRTFCLIFFCRTI